MVTLRQAAEQALEALERADKISGYPNNAAAIKALRQALEAEQQDDPVAYAVPGAVEWKRRQSEVTIKLTRKPHPEYGFTEPLYTNPKPRHPLTEEQINDHRLALSCASEDLPDPLDFKQGVRAAERAHGIGGEA